MASNKYITELFEKQAKRNPFSKAAICNDTLITYEDLDKKSNQFSRYLQSVHKIKSGDVVGLCVENKSINLLIAILGVLKSGAAYQAFNISCAAVMESPGYKHLTCILGDHSYAVDGQANIDQII